MRTSPAFDRGAPDEGRYAKNSRNTASPHSRLARSSAWSNEMTTTPDHRSGQIIINGSAQLHHSNRAPPQWRSNGTGEQPPVTRSFANNIFIYTNETFVNLRVKFFDAAVTCQPGAIDRGCAEYQAGETQDKRKEDWKSAGSPYRGTRPYSVRYRTRLKASQTEARNRLYRRFSVSSFCQAGKNGPDKEAAIGGNIEAALPQSPFNDETADGCA